MHLFTLEKYSLQVEFVAKTENGRNTKVKKHFSFYIPFIVQLIHVILSASRVKSSLSEYETAMRNLNGSDQLLSGKNVKLSSFQRGKVDIMMSTVKYVNVKSMSLIVNSPVRFLLMKFVTHIRCLAITKFSRRHSANSC